MHIPFNKYLIAMCRSIDDSLEDIEIHQYGMAYCIESSMRYAFVNRLEGPMVDALRDIIRHIDAQTLTPKVIQERLKPLFDVARNEPPFG